jgi:hypothetical protein
MSEARVGDTLVIAVNDSISAEQAQAIKDQFAETLPGVKVVVVSKCSAVTVVRGSSDAA